MTTRLPVASVGSERGGRADRAIALATLLIVAALAWVYLWRESGHMAPMQMPGGMDMGGLDKGMSRDLANSASPWDPAAFLLTFTMWVVMMTGMMLPSAIPAIALYGGLARKHRAVGSMLPSVWLFTGGYLGVWAGFSLLASTLQTGLGALRLLTPTLSSASVWMTVAVLIVAGVYQWLPLKAACLRRCRAPLQFLLFHWRSSPLGVVRMGAEHGAYCVGCCWALMLLLFTAGIMNLLWVAMIAAYVMIEKLFPNGQTIARIAGVGLIAAGVGLALAQALGPG